ncbi:hypothetical protein BDR04DRAFT_1109270 [Suillus decipiens]|nr:hypothetical protein BDR04DRAFT_1109270 [Suillus decipiens]
MQGGFLTEDDLEKYLASGEHPWTNIVTSSSFSYGWRQPHCTAFRVGEPSLTSRCSSGSPLHDQWVHRMPEIQQLPSESRPDSSCCTTVISPDPMPEANFWTRMVTRPSLKRPRQLMNYNMQQDVLSIVRIDDSFSAESVTVVEMPDSVLKPMSYSGNKPPEMTIDACDEKSRKSVQSDPAHSIGRATSDAILEGKGKGIEKQASYNSCFLPKLRLDKAWKRLRCWTTTTLRDMKSQAARLSLATQPISLASCSNQHDIWRYPQGNNDRGQPI